MNTSLDLLAHFDEPPTTETTRRAPRRGIGWVLQWSSALATLFFAVVLLAQFGYCLTWERALARAARAAALEATLPRATPHSVEQAIKRRLAGDASTRLRFSLHHNGAPVRGLIQAGEGDRLAVTLALPARDILPRWLHVASFWQGASQISVRAERQLPSRQLRDR